ncbi:MAG: thiamine/thiamine pyrophosphate ABC transporter permease ThiP [Devosia sp.]|nr:thiamine/thiamine pyrophosphate ABC transporter permease ThiP [Devosia sp.]
MPRSSNLALPRRPLRLLAGAAVAFGIAALVGLVLATILTATSGDSAAPSRVDVWQLLRMTAIQAGLSTLLSLVAGTALAWALNRLRFVGRELVVGLFASAIVTPGLVVAFGLLAIWGRAGWVNQTALALTGQPLEVPLFGLGGILAAHVILDGAFAARILLARLDAVPDLRLKTGQSLGLSAWQRFAIIDWPMLQGAIPGLGAIIFLLAFTSFPIVLLLGGGPANQTLEVAIYAAVRLDFDLRGAVQLALVQIGVCAAVILLATAAAPVSAVTGGSRVSSWRDRGAARALQWLVLALGMAGFGLPLLAVLANGIGPGMASLLVRPGFWHALGTSLGLGAASAILTLLMALTIGTARAAAGTSAARTLIGAPAFAYLAVPAVVLSLGAFLIVRALGAQTEASAAPAVVLLANALMSLPFAVATLGPPLDAVTRSRGKLIRSLGLDGWQQFRDIEWPLVRREAGIVLALAFCFSLGDLGVIALLGTQDFTTLPLLMYRALGAYRTNDAGTIAAVMLLVTIIAFVAIPRLFEVPDARR